MNQPLDYDAAAARVLGAPRGATPALAPSATVTTGAPAAGDNPYEAVADRALAGVSPDLGRVQSALSGTALTARPGPTVDRAQLMGSTRMGPTRENAQALAILRGADRILNDRATPDVVAEVRRIARDTQTTIPLAASTYVEQAARASDERRAALLNANPALRQLTSRHGYADLVRELDGLAAVEQAANTLAGRAILSPAGRDRALATDVEEELTFLEGLGAAVGRGTLQTVASAPYAAAMLDVADIMDIGRSQEEIRDRIAARYGVPVDQLPASIRATVEQAAAQQYAWASQLTEEDTPRLLNEAANSLASASAFIELGERLGRSPQTEQFLELLATKENTVGDTIAAFFEEPLGGAAFLSETLAESAPSLIAALTISRLTGTPILGATAAGAGSLTREGVNTAMGYIAEQGYTITTVDDAIAVLGNEELMAEANRQGLVRGVIIGTLDAIAGGLAGTPFSSRPLVDLFVQSQVQGGLGAAGEVLGSLAATGEIDAQAAFIEYLAELPTTLIEVPGIGLRRFGEVRAERRTTREIEALLAPGGFETAQSQAEQAAADLETTRAAIEATQTFVRDPEAVRELLQAAGDQEVSIPAAEIERLYQEGVLLDSDIDYLQVEEEVTQQGVLSGDVSIPASRLLTLQGDAFPALIDHVRVTPDALTVAEARDAIANREADIERLQGVLQQAEQAVSEVAALTDTITRQLESAGALTRGQRRAAAGLLAERYAARAARFDDTVTATSLYERDRVQFLGEGQVAQPSLEQASGPAIDPQVIEQAQAALVAVPEGRPVQMPDSAELLSALSAAGLSVGQDRLVQPSDIDAAAALLTQLPLEQGPVPAADRLDIRAPVRSPRGSTYMGVGQQYTVENPNTDAPALQRNAPLIQASTNANNAEGQSEALDALLERHPDPLASEAAWVDLANDAFSLDRVPMPPFRTIEIVQQGPETIANEIRQLSEGMRRDAEAGLQTAQEFGEVYASGAATPDITAKAFLWSFLSRGVSPYVQEAAFLDAIVSDRLTSIMQRATADGWSDALEAEYGEWAASAIPPGSPGRGTQHNLNAFGRNFMRVMTQRHDDAGGRTGLEIIHGMIADGTPSYLIRREFLKRGSGAGIDNKVVSFTLLLLGRSDVLVLDRVQVRNQWNDGRFDGQNIYDSDIDAEGKQVTGSAFAEMTFGHKGLLYYETMERALQPLIEQAYTSLGIEGSLGRYHWDSWLLASNQEVGHASVEGLLRDAQGREAPYVGAFVRQGKYANYDYGFRYGVLPDGGLSTVVERLDGTGAVIVPYAVMADPKSPARKMISRLSTAAKKRGTEYGSVRPWTAALTAEERATYDNAIADAGAPAPDVWQYDPNAVGRAAVAREQRGTGSYSDGELAPLEGAPTVAGAAGPDPSLVAIAEQYAAANGIDLRRQAEFVEVDPERAARIAQAYDEMPHSPQDPEVKAAYQNLIEQTVAQYEALVAGGYEFYFFDENSDPYEGNPWNAMRDLRANKRMGVYATEAGFGSGATELNVDDNPMLADTGIMWSYGSPDGPQQRVLANDLFRAVHDAFGHGIEGAGFRARGEENAWQAHVRLFTGSAVAAITTETRGQNSWLNYGPYGEQNRTASVEDTVFADQKTGLMPSFTWEEGRAGDEPAAATVLEQPADGPQTATEGAVGAPRGAYFPPKVDDGPNILQLTASADASTFVHEVGHMFMYQMLRDLSDPRLTDAGRAEISAQIDATRAWFGQNAEQGLADLKRLSSDVSKRAKRDKSDAQLQLRARRLEAAVQRANEGGGSAYMAQVAAAFMDPKAQGYDEAAEVVFHELWARGFESYIGSGSAPSEGLRTIFARFAKYITSIYKSLRRLNVEVSPEVADVFDRLLATEDAIQQERRGAVYQISPGVLDGATPAEARELRRLAAQAEDEARTQIARREQNALDRQARERRDARRRQLTTELTEQVAAEPVYTAISVITTGSTPNGEVVLNTGKLDRAEVVAQADAATADAIPKHLISGRTPPKNPTPLPQLAMISGFPDIDSMLLSLMDHALPSLQEEVRARVDAQMQEEFGAETDPTELSNDAIAAAQNERFQQLQRLQLRILRRLAAEPLAQVARRQAEQTGAPAADADQAAVTAAQAEQAAATSPRQNVQASLARIRADVQRQANAPQRRAQAAAGRQTRTIQRNVDPATIQAAAKRYVQSLTVQKATPARYRQAAARLTTKIERAIAARDYAEASSLMEQRALNLAVALEAAEVQSMIDKKRRRWRDLTGRSNKRLAQNYDMNWVNAIRVVLEPLGLGRAADTNYSAQADLAALEQVEPALYKDIIAQIGSAGVAAQTAAQADPKQPHRALTVGRLTEIFELADQLLANARNSHGLLIDGRRVEFGKIAAEVSTYVDNRRSVSRRERRNIRRTTAQARRDRRGSGLISSLLRAEALGRDLDNGDPRGPVTRYLVRPIMAAVDAFHEARLGPIQRLVDALQAQPDLLKTKLIDASELAPGFSFENRGQLLMAILNSGNESNLRKLLMGGAKIGNQWSSWTSTQSFGEDLDTSRWDAFLNRMFAEGVITKADMDAVQSIWDLFEDTKAGAQAAHQRMFGYRFVEIEDAPVVTPFGTYRGGYVPAVLDRLSNPEAQNFDAQEVMSQQSNASMFPGAEKGFTQNRTNATYVLDLDIARLPSHFDRVMRFTHLGPAVQQAARLMNNPDFMAQLDRVNPTLRVSALIPWLQRTVQQQVVTPDTNAFLQWAAPLNKALERRVGILIMGGNLFNAAEQLTGLFPALARVPARHLLAASTTWRMSGESARRHMIEASPFMAERIRIGSNEILTQLDNLMREPGLLNRVSDFGIRYSYFAQQIVANMMEPTIWLAAERDAMARIYPTAYAEALARTGDDTQADAAAKKEVYAYADEVVRSTQGSTRPSDISGVEANTALARLTLKFYSYFNMLTNLAKSEMTIAMNSEMGWSGRYGRAFYVYLMTFAATAIVSKLMREALTGGLDDLEDEEVLPAVTSILVGSQVEVALASVPFVGSILAPAYGQLTDSPFDDSVRASAGYGIAGDAVGGVASLLLDIVDPETDVETVEGARRALNAIGLALGLPTNWATKALRYAERVQAGDADPEGLVDYIQGLLTGRDGTEQ